MIEMEHINHPKNLTIKRAVRLIVGQGGLFYHFWMRYVSKIARPAPRRPESDILIYVKWFICGFIKWIPDNKFLIDKEFYRVAEFLEAAT